MRIRHGRRKRQVPKWRNSGVDTVALPPDQRHAVERVVEQLTEVVYGFRIICSSNISYAKSSGRFGKQLSCGAVLLRPEKLFA